MDTSAQSLYATIQTLVQQEITNSNNGTPSQSLQSMAQFNIANIDTHAHTGLDSPQIDPRSLLGFPIVIGTPTATVPSGTIYISTDSLTTPTVAHFFVRIGTTWKQIT